MALEILTFINEMAGGLVSPIRRQLGYLFHYKRNIDRLKEEGERLEAIRRDVERVVVSAERNGKEIKDEVRAWLSEVDSITTKMQWLDDEGQMNKRCINGWCPNCYWRYRVGRRAAKEAATVSDIQKRGNFGDNVSHPRLPPVLMPTADSHPSEPAKEATMEVMEALKEDKVSIVGVHGMGGVGKTTMVDQVATQVIDMGLFNYVANATVSQNPNVRKIQGEIADFLGLKLEEESDKGRASRLMETIMRCKRILIILDDVWSRNIIELSKVGIPSSSDLMHCESKIILTTREEHVCRVMGAQVVIHHKLLSEEEAWILFRSKAGAVVDFAHINPVAKNVARECGGLPLALVTVGKALAGQDVEEWKKAARRLKKSEPANPNDEDVFERIKLSYDFLRRKDRKACFLICSLFPEDYDINMEDLVRYGTGLGLFQNAHSMEEARGEAQTVVKHLQASCLLLDTGRKGYVKMHDVIRDVAIRIASSGDEHVFMVQAGLRLKRWPHKDSLENYTGISLMSNKISNLPDELECPKLQALLLQDNTDLQEIPCEFFRKMITLKILDLSSIQISSLPTSIGLLTNLQTLCLDGCRSTDVSALGNLKKLKILSLKNSRIEALPEQMGQLSNLRILDLTNNVQMMIPPKVISRLSCLEELYMEGSFAQWRHGVKGEEEEEATTASFDEIIDLPCLTILKVDISDYKCMPRDIRDFPKWIKYDICISGFKSAWLEKRVVSRELTTTYSKGLLLDIETRYLPFWFNEVVSKRVECLIYSECGFTNILVEYDEGKLTGLRSLVVQRCCNIFSLMNAVGRIPNKLVFESLEELHVDYMDNMKELCIGELPQGSFHNLKYLDVQQCKELGNALLQSNLLQRLQNLERIYVSFSSSLREVFRLEGHEEEQFYLRRLKKMMIYNLPELIKIWNGPTPPAMFHNLNVVRVIGCDKLRNLFTLTITAGLLQLEELWIEDCGALEFIVGKEEEEESRDKIKFPQLKNLILKYLLKLSSFYAGSSGIECLSLEKLHVRSCPNFETCASNFHSTKQVHEVNSEQDVDLLRFRGLW